MMTPFRTSALRFVAGVASIQLALISSVMVLASPADAATMAAWTAVGDEVDGAHSDNAVTGYEFVPSVDIQVTHLGMADMGEPGLLNDHGVGLWANDGTLLAEVELSAGVSNILLDDFRYEALGSAILLEAGTTYVVAVHWTRIFPDPNYDNGLHHQTGALIHPLLTKGSNRFALSQPELAFPINVSGITNVDDVGASFLFQVVPEPSSALLLGGGLSLLGIARRRRLIARSPSFSGGASRSFERVVASSATAAS